MHVYLSRLGTRSRGMLQSSASASGKSRPPWAVRQLSRARQRVIWRARSARKFKVNHGIFIAIVATGPPRLSTRQNANNEFVASHRGLLRLLDRPEWDQRTQRPAFVLLTHSPELNSACVRESDCSLQSFRRIHTAHFPPLSRFHA